jgi:SEC-C motif-containing protein
MPSGDGRRPDRCPCGTGLPYDRCCSRLHRGDATAVTAEELMRARYSAYAVGDESFVRASWDEASRPTTPVLDASVTWTGLTVHGGRDGRALDREGTVSFTATFRRPDGRTGAVCEDSRFARVGGRWRYVDGTSRSR